MDEKPNSRITRKTIGGTVYVVESLESDTAKETVYDKVMRLVISDASCRIKLSDSSALCPQIDSTSSK
ncbi:MAG: transposon-encoded TnpW family protein [Christensenellales bacterium]|jgi:hypothetical protein